MSAPSTALPRLRRQALPPDGGSEPCATSEAVRAGAVPLRVAIVGCGKIADGHVETIRHIAGARVVAVCDLEPLMAEQLAVRYGVPGFYGDFTQLLERERPDVVHITTPP